MAESKETALGEALRVLAEKGVITRGQEGDIQEQHAWLVSVGELPELERGKLHEKLVVAPDETGTNVAGISARQVTPNDLVPESEAPASLGSFGVLEGTLSVDRSNEEVETLDDSLVTSDDEATTPRKRSRK